MNRIKRTHPANLFLSGNNNVEFGYFPSYEYYFDSDDEQIDATRRIHSYEGTGKYIVSRQFMKYANAAKDEIIKHFDSISFEFHRKSRAFAIGDKGYLVTIENRHGQTDVFVDVFKKSRTHDYMWYFTGYFTGLEYQDKRKDSEIWMDGKFEDRDESKDAIEAIIIFVFMEVGDAITEVVKPGESKKVSKKKVVNDTNYEWKFLTANYFKTSVRNEGFPVSGHFRMQRYGPGLTKQKLIFIEPFEKKGYTRKGYKK